MKDFREGSVWVLYCTIAAGMGCDIHDVKVAVIYSTDSFVLFIQKGENHREIIGTQK